MIQEKFMARAIQLAYNGFPEAFPNPMVGAVITDFDGNIIGEGYHRKCGTPHAEVNAVNAVADKSMLKRSIMYVSLEPCAHYGRTPPCAQLIIDCGIPEVVIGTKDLFAKVDGKGIKMLRDAGVKVTVGVLEEQCRSLNAVFFTAHARKRPFVLLKWAQSADGYIDGNLNTPVKFSTHLSSVMMHRLRGACDAIMVGSNTVLNDNPSLSCRLWPGKSPMPVIIDRSNRVTADYKLLQHHHILINTHQPLDQMLHDLYLKGYTFLMVEGGASLLNSFISGSDSQGLPLWDMARVEVADFSLFDNGRVAAPSLGMQPVKSVKIDSNNIYYYTNNPLIHVKNF